MKNAATLSQGKHLAELFENLKSGQLQALIASGLFTDLRRCATEFDPTKVNRDEFKRILGLDPDVFKVKMGGVENTDQITAALGFFFNDWITQKNFPLKPSENPWEDEIEIVDPGCAFSEEEGLQILKNKGLKRPMYEHAIRVAEQHGKTMASEKKPFVVFLHKVWQDPDGNRRVVYVDRDPGHRRLALYYSGERFSGSCVLAGVRRRK